MRLRSPPTLLILCLCLCLCLCLWLLGSAAPAQAQWSAGNVTLRATHSATGSGIGYVLFSNQANTTASTAASGTSSSSGEQSYTFGRQYTKTGSPPDLSVTLDAYAYTDSYAWGGFPFGMGEGITEAYAESLSFGPAFAYAAAWAYSNSGIKITDFGNGSFPAPVGDDLDSTEWIEVLNESWSSSQSSGSGEADARGQTISYWSNP
jgi:hypothetical protein